MESTSQSLPPPCPCGWMKCSLLFNPHCFPFSRNKQEIGERLALGELWGLDSKIFAVYFYVKFWPLIATKLEQKLLPCVGKITGNSPCLFVPPQLPCIFYWQLPVSFFSPQSSQIFYCQYQHNYNPNLIGNSSIFCCHMPAIIIGHQQEKLLSRFQYYLQV